MAAVPHPTSAPPSDATRLAGEKGKPVVRDCVAEARKSLTVNLGVTSALSVGAHFLFRKSRVYNKIHWRMRTILHVSAPLAISYFRAESQLTDCAHEDYASYKKWKSY